MSHSNNDTPTGDLRLGIDVGGTNTDAVIVDLADQVLASAKSPTTQDVTSGVENALRAVLADSHVSPTAIRYAMLGTTHCTNAIVTRRGLNRVGVIRLGAPATGALRTRPRRVIRKQATLARFRRAHFSCAGPRAA